MSLFEYHQFQVENLEQNFLSLRQVEWQVVFQAYAGYAAIGVAYYSLASNEAPGRGLGWLTICAVLFVFVVSLYASLRVQERLANLRRIEKQHFDKLAELVGETYESPTTVSKPGFWFKIHQKPIHGKWYGFASQQAISLAWLVGIIWFVIYKTGAATMVCG